MKLIVLLALLATVYCEELSGGAIGGIVIAGIFFFFTWPLWLFGIILLPWLVGFVLTLIICFPVVIVCAPCIVCVVAIILCLTAAAGDD